MPSYLQHGEISEVLYTREQVASPKTTIVYQDNNRLSFSRASRSNRALRSLAASSHRFMVLKLKLLTASPSLLSQHYKPLLAGQPLIVVAILKGSFMFFSDLVKELDVDLTTEFMILKVRGSRFL